MRRTLETSALTLPGAMEPHSGQNQRVLIVEDHGALLSGFTDVFEHAGRTVVPCRTFESARQRLRTEHFSALVTDVRLGPFNGLQLAVIARDKYWDMPIVVLTGFDDPVLRREAAQLRAIYLVKPVSAQELLELTSDVRIQASATLATSNPSGGS